jgi:hypothetical protein
MPFLRAMTPQTPHHKRPAWSSRLLSGTGFLLAGGLLLLLMSGHVATAKAQNYVRDRCQADVDVPVREVRADFLTGPTASGRPLPPLGFCWTIEFDAGSAEAEVSVSPWTHEVIDWRGSL